MVHHKTVTLNWKKINYSKGKIGSQSKQNRFKFMDDIKDEWIEILTSERESGWSRGSWNSIPATRV